MSRDLKNRLAAGIENRAQRQALGAAMRRGREGRASAVLAIHDNEALRQNVRRVKEQSIDELDNLLSEFVAKTTAKGVKVFFAKDGASAIRYIADVAKANEAKLIVKSKSLTSEEIEMNHP